AATEYDPDVGVAVAHRARRRSTERRVVDALGRIGAVVDDLVTGCPQPLDQVLLELVAGVVGSERDSCHRGECRSGVPSATGPVDETSGGATQSTSSPASAPSSGHAVSRWSRVAGVAGAVCRLGSSANATRATA